MSIGYLSVLRRSADAQVARMAPEDDPNHAMYVHMIVSGLMETSTTRWFEKLETQYG